MLILLLLLLALLLSIGVAVVAIIVDSPVQCLAVGVDDVVAVVVGAVAVAVGVLLQLLRLVLLVVLLLSKREGTISIVQALVEVVNTILTRQHNIEEERKLVPSFFCNFSSLFLQQVHLNSVV